MPESFESCREKILSEEYYDIITDFPIRPESAEGADLCYVQVESFFNIVYWNRNQVVNADNYFYSHRNLPKLYGLMQEETPDFSGNLSPESRVSFVSEEISASQIPGAEFDPNSLIISGITQVQREPLNLEGNGCVIVFIDTGINYADAAFRREDGSSRILAIWDQTIQTGTPPEGFYYGTEYTGEEINRALQSENPYSIVPSRDTNGHGSNMAGVAAGSRLRNGISYLGAAPGADIVVVKLKECKQYLRDFYLIPQDVPAYQETDIMLAVQYGNTFADTFRRPVVFCLGIGTNYGDHAGSSALSRYLNAVAVRRSRAVVVCGGDEGNADHHFQGEMEDEQGERLQQKRVEIRVGENAQGFLLEFWGSIPDAFSVAVRSPGGETIPPVRLGIRDAITYDFIYEETEITIAGELVEPASGEELITLRVKNPTAGIWTFQVAAVGEIHNGTFHMWLPITQFLNTEVMFLEASPYVTLTEPAMASDCISVSTYDASNNSFYIESGRGFSRVGTIFPDFAAPGVNVSTIRGTNTGSSLAAAITAGAVAQFMEWAVVEENNVAVESREIKNYFVRGASRDFGLNYPNREWGYGRLNMVGVFNALIGV